MVTSSGGVVDAADMARRADPLDQLRAGDGAGRRPPLRGARRPRSEDAVVADTGGTSYDVTLVRRGRIPVTRETWLGPEYEGHITGFPAVDVRSVGAGGGSIAWIDAGGLLHVGPQSAGADPGPVCYGRGGSEPTVTDACVVLGYIDPGLLPRRHDATRRRRCERAIDAAGRRAARARRARGGGGDHGRRDRADGPGDRGDHGQPGRRPAQRRAGRRRRRGRAERRRDRAPARLAAHGDPAGRRRAERARRADVRPDRASTRLGVLHRLRRVRPRARRGGARRSCARAASSSRERNGSGGDAEIEFVAEARYRHQVWQLDVPLREGRLGTPRGASRTSSRTSTRSTRRSSRCATSAPSSRSSTCARASTARCEAVARTRSRSSTRTARPPSMRSVYFSGAARSTRRSCALEAMAPGAQFDRPGDHRVVVHDDRAEPRRERRTRRRAAAS